MGRRKECGVRTSAATASRSVGYCRTMAAAVAVASREAAAASQPCVGALLAGCGLGSSSVATLTTDSGGVSEKYAETE
ncbi:hypothetical protein Cni_G02521 [Canna indica]|uniref:Uncharacterized protein n=1 Tax=Canna indica TaxID=4628 RepID=A0AAQ3Q290_9LILI|nr:hypothetical protein Cni_G02521 [Canna indica]